MGAAMAAEFWALGLGEPHPVSSIHGAGTGDLLDLLLAGLPANSGNSAADPVQMAIIGRPNVGKSSLLNAVCGEQRAIVSPERGTTRDSIDTLLERQGQQWRLVDTAGIRRRGHVAYGPEFFGIDRQPQGHRRSDVCLLVIDAEDAVTEQDQRLAGLIAREGRACVVAVNKWGRRGQGQPYPVGHGAVAAGKALLSRLGRDGVHLCQNPATGGAGVSPGAGGG